MQISPMSHSLVSPRLSAARVVTRVAQADDSAGHGQSGAFREGSGAPRQLLRLVVEAQMLASASRDVELDARTVFDVSRTLQQVDRLSDFGQRSSVTLRI